MDWWFFKIFIPWASENGYKILRDDYKWMIPKIWVLEESEQKLVIREYLKYWKLGMNETEKPHQKDNKGRFRANTFLREYIDKKNED